MNPDGDVILVPDQSGIGTCVSQTILNSNGGIDLGGNNLYFTGLGSVGIGVPCGNTLVPKFTVEGQTNVSGYFKNQYPGTSISVLGWSSSSGGNWIHGGRFLATGNGQTRGVSGYASSTGTWAKGGEFEATGSTTNYGIYSRALPASNATSTVAGYFNGDVFTTSSQYFTSDSHLKTNINSIPEALPVIRQLEPHSFYFDTMQYNFIGFPSEKQYGFTADEVDSVIPELVKPIIHPAEFDSLGNEISPEVQFKALNYTGLIPFAIQAVKDLDSIVSGISSGTVTTTGSPSAGTIPVFTGSSTIGNSNIYDDGANVGIGVNNPLVKLDVNGIGHFSEKIGIGTTAPSAMLELRKFDYSAEGQIIKIRGFDDGGNTGLYMINDSPFNFTRTSLSFANYGTAPVTQLDQLMEIGGGTSSFKWRSQIPGGNFLDYLNVNLGSNQITFNSGKTGGAPAFGNVIVANGNVGIGVGSPSEKLEVNGNVKIPPGYQYLTNSDGRLKKNIDSIPNALSIINSLQGVYYEIDTTAYNSYFPSPFYINPDDSLPYPTYHNLSSGRKIGFIAQEVEPYLPEAVDIDSSGFYSMDYSKIVPVLVEAIKQQKQTIDSLKNQNEGLQGINDRLTSIENCINNLPPGMCGGSARKANPGSSDEASQKIILKSENAAILYQNEPNPFGNSTVIRYYVPESAGEAMLVFYDEFGREVSKEILNSKGYSKVDIDAGKLAAGIYTYSIIVDGKIADTKKMIRSK